MKSLKLFWLFTHNAYKTTMQGRLGIVFFTIGKLVRFAMTFLFIMLIYSRVNILKGYTFTQVALFFLVYNLIDTTSQVLFREVYRFRPLVVSGSFDTILLKPYHPFVRILFGGVDLIDAVLLVPYFLLCVFFALSIHTTVFQMSLFFLLLLNGVWIATSFHILVLSFAILTTGIDHTMMIYRDISSLGRFPMDIYKEPVRSLFTFVIPVGIMMSFPAQALFGKLGLFSILFAFTISIGFCLVSLSFWKLALKHYQSWGG